MADADVGTVDLEIIVQGTQEGKKQELRLWLRMLSTTKLRVQDFMLGTAIGVIPAVALMVLSADAVMSGPTAIEAALIGAAIVLVFGLGTLVRRRVGI
jgi:sulfite exporter TauE/SafE